MILFNEFGTSKRRDYAIAKVVYARNHSTIAFLRIIPKLPTPIEQ